MCLEGVAVHSIVPAAGVSRPAALRCSRLHSSAVEPDARECYGDVGATRWVPLLDGGAYASRQFCTRLRQPPYRRIGGRAWRAGPALTARQAWRWRVRAGLGGG